MLGQYEKVNRFLSPLKQMHKQIPMSPKPLPNKLFQTIQPATDKKSKNKIKHMNFSKLR